GLGLLVHLVGLLVHLVRLLLAVFFLAVLLGHLVLLVHLLFHLVRLVHLLVLRDRGEAHGRKHRRDEDCNKLLHRHPLLWLYRKDPPEAQSAPYNAAAYAWLTRPFGYGGSDCKSTAYGMQSRL